MLDTVKEILHIEGSDIKSQKNREHIMAAANEKFQVAEWNGKLYIVVDGVPVKNSFETIEAVISELEIFRTTWVSYVTEHPALMNAILRNA